MHIEPTAIARGDGGQRRLAAAVRLDGENFGRTLHQEAARQPAGTRADLDDQRVAERSRGAGDPARQVEIEDEVLAEALLGAKIEALDHLA